MVSWCNCRKSRSEPDRAPRAPSLKAVRLCLGIDCATGYPIAMMVYRCLMRALTPILALHAGWQRLRGRIGAGGMAERLGRGTGRSNDPAVWFHGASNGELTSARWLIERLRAARPDLAMVITCNSWSARTMVQGWGLPGVAVCLAPYDTPGAVAAFRARWRPRALIFIENELWPERVAQMTGPVICLGARMSAGSARNWARIAPGLMAAVLSRITLLSAQDAQSEARFLALGLPAARLGPRLMLKTRPATDAPRPFTPPHPRARILLAASTHPGEEAPILRAFAQVRGATFDLLILAPRHPRRSAEVAATIRATGLTFATRSAGEVPGPDTAVYLADTLGEMAGWYAMAGATLIGGTFAPVGGHTPYEPAAHGSAILHGPGVANFTESFATLTEADAALPVTEASLAVVLADLSPQRQSGLAARAQLALAPADDGAALLAAVLDQLSG